MEQTEQILKALANKRRLAIVKLLSNNAKYSVGHIAKEIKLSLKATSKHLGILFNANILEKEQVNLLIYYSLVRPTSSIVRSVVGRL
ncbi:MAG: metalloregulator ArsR/SmtB family transcription factor [Candidatus Doudnabacteria bacterium]|nr:metalloregulator ArsR/SmtB family transcription factor [Candidatus Doudnabacteria bacterium]